MKKFLLILPLTCANAFCLLAQPSIQWQQSLGGTAFDGAHSIEQTTDSGYIVAGFSDSNDNDVTANHGIDDYWIAKLNSTGIIQWQKCLGGTGSDGAFSIQQTTDSGYVVAGYSDSNDSDVTGNHGGYDSWVVKLNGTGAIQWQNSLGGTGDDEATSIRQTIDGGYIVTGYTSSNDSDVTGQHGDYDYWVVKLNGTGIIQWQKCLGGTGDDEAFSIQQTTDSGYVVAGYSDSNDSDVTANHGGYDYWVVKLNSAGTMQWQKSLGGTGDEYASFIRQTTDGGYIVAGSSDSNDGDVTGNQGSYDFWVVKLNGTGVIQWQKCLGGTNDDEAYSIQQTTDSGFIVAGYSGSNDGDVTGNHGNYDNWLVKLNSTGILQWQKSLGGIWNEEAYSIQQTPDAGYIVAGYSESDDGDVAGNHGYYDFWIVKLSPVTGTEEINQPVANLQVIPNPASLSAVISFSLLQSEDISVNVYDITGRAVKKLFDGILNSGVHEIKWNFANEPAPDAGVYLLNVSGDHFSQSFKLVVVE